MISAFTDNVIIIYLLLCSEYIHNLHHVEAGTRGSNKQIQQLALGVVVGGIVLIRVTANGRQSEHTYPVTKRRCAALLAKGRWPHNSPAGITVRTNCDTNDNNTDNKNSDNKY